MLREISSRGYKKEVKCWSRLGHSCRSLSRFLWHEAARSISTPPRWHVSPLQITPPKFVRFPPVPIYTPGWTEALWESSVLPKNKTQFLRPGVEPGPLDQGTRALTTRPPDLLERLCHVGNRMIATNTTLILIDGMFFICLLKLSYNLNNG